MSARRTERQTGKMTDDRKASHAGTMYIKGWEFVVAALKTAILRLPRPMALAVWLDGKAPRFGCNILRHLGIRSQRTDHPDFGLA